MVLTRNLALLFCLLLLAACGGGGSSPGGVSRDSTVVASTDLAVRVLLPQSLPRQNLARSLTQIRVSLFRSENSEVPVQTTEQAIEPGQSEAVVRLLSVLPGQYYLVVEAAADSGSPLQASQPITVSIGQVTSVLVNLAATPPSAVDDSYSTLADVPLTVAAGLGVLANDSSVGGTVAVNAGPTSGSLSLSPDGSFTYQPNAGFVGSDTFSYTLTDANGSATANVTISIPGRGLFVKAGATGSGSLTDPRPDLDGALTAAMSGDVVFAYFSTLPLTTATPMGIADFVVPPGVSLVGEGSGLILDGVTVIPAGSKPVIRNSVQLRSNTVLRGVRVEDTAASTTAVNVNDLPNPASNVTIDNCELVSNGMRAINGINPTQTFSVTNCSLQAGSYGLIMGQSAATPANIIFDGNSVTAGSDAALIFAAAASNLTATVTNNTVTGALSCRADGTGSSMQATMVGNTVLSSAGQGLAVQASNESSITAMLRANMVSNTAGPGLSISEDSNAVDTITCDANTFSQTHKGVELFSGGSLDLIITNNSFVNLIDLLGFFRSTGPGALRIRFEANQASAGDIDVSQFSGSSSIDFGLLNNTLSGKMIVTRNSGAAAFCAKVTGNNTLSQIDLDNNAPDAAVFEGFPNLVPPVTFNFINGTAADGGPCSLP